jgi:sortase A
MIRKLGFVLTLLGLALMTWVGVTLLWGEPLTSLYTRHEQQRLSNRLDTLDRQWSAKTTKTTKTTKPRVAASGAAAAGRLAATERLAAVMSGRGRQFQRSLEDGRPIGRIIVPRLGLNMVVVDGTSETDLEQGPGHYDALSGVNTSLPGLGGVVAIAGHRTTYLHPFRHIDDLRPGDDIYLRMPYGIFGYRVYMHRIVGSTDWSILHQPHFEKLVLSACHPLYSATHRFVVYARLHSERNVPPVAAAGA